MILQTTDQDIRFTDRTLDRFRFRLNYDVKLYLDLYHFFIKNNKQFIIDFYQKSEATGDYQSFTFLDKLYGESIKINGLIRNKKNVFNRLDDWELLEFLETVHTNLETLKNANRWLRSNRSINSWHSQKVEYKFTLKQSQTLENLTREADGSLDEQNDWVNIAVENDLRESDYTIDGGNIIRIGKKITNSLTNVASCTSIVDALSGENLYGLDINKKLTFTDSDIEVLTYRETFLQTVLIHIQLKKGDIPEFPTLGVDADLTAGSVLGKFVYNSMVRQLESVFASDDSMRNFKVTNISYQNRDVFVNYTVDSLYHLTYNNISKV